MENIRSERASLGELFDLRRFDEAQALLDADDALAPESEAELYRFYQLLMADGRSALISALCDRYLQRDPVNLTAWSILANLQFNAGDFEGARRSCLHSLAADSNNVAALVMLGMISQSQGELAQAIDFYEKALESDAVNPAALSGLARIHQAAGENNQAIERYKQALASDPSNLVAIENLRYLLAQAGRLAEFEPFQEKRIAWDSVLFDEARDRFLSDDAVVREAAERVLSAGFVVLRSAIDPKFVAQLLSLIDSYRALPGVDPAKRVVVSVKQLIRLFSITSGDDAFLNPVLLKILSEVFGRRPAIDFSKSVLRQVRGDDPDSHVPFHQDMRAFGEMGINVWIPLTPAGGDRPGLQLLPGRTRRLIEVEPSSGEYSYVEINRRSFRFDESLLVAPVMRPGDCILFLGDVVHRTYLPEHPGGDRTSLELRLFG